MAVTEEVNTAQVATTPSTFIIEDVSDQLSSDVVEIFATEHAFAALKADGSSDVG